MKRLLVTGLMCIMLGVAAYAAEPLPDSLRAAFLNEDTDTEMVSGLIIIKFGFEGCGPCKSLDQVFAQYGMEAYIQARKARFYETNLINELKLSPNLCALWRLGNAAPQLLFLYNGKKVGHLKGFPAKIDEQEVGQKMREIKSIINQYTAVE